MLSAVRARGILGTSASFAIGLSGIASIVLIAGALGLGALGAGFGVATLALARRAAGLAAIPLRESVEGTLLPPVT